MVVILVRGVESTAHMDVGKARELGAEALRRKKVHFPPNLTQSTPTPGENNPQIGIAE